MTERSTRLCSLDEVTAVVLTGGLGTRLRDAVSDRPKTLAAVAGRPFLDYVLDQLYEAGVTEAVLCTGYLSEQIEAHIGSRHGDLAVRYSIERALLGTAGAVRFALDQVSTNRLLVLNGDSYCDLDLPTFVAAHLHRRSTASMAVTAVRDTRRYGRVTVDAEGRISAFEEKGALAGPGYINAGIYLFEREELASLPRGRPLSLERQVFPRLVEEGRLFGFDAGDSTFIDIGTPESLEEANELFHRCPPNPRQFSGGA